MFWFFVCRSLACILYEMCCMDHAFSGSNFLSVVLNIVEGNTPSLPDRYPRELNIIMSRYASKSEADTVWSSVTVFGGNLGFCSFGKTFSLWTLQHVEQESLPETVGCRDFKSPLCGRVPSGINRRGWQTICDLTCCGAESQWGISQKGGEQV